MNYHGDIYDLDQLYLWYLSAHNSPLRVFHFECPFFGLLCARQIERQYDYHFSFHMRYTWPHNKYHVDCQRPQREQYSGVIPLKQINMSLVRIYRLYCWGMKMIEPTLQDFLDFLGLGCRLYFGNTKVDIIVRSLTRRHVHGLFTCVGTWWQSHCPGKVRYKTSNRRILINKRKLPRSKASHVMKTKFRRNRAELIIRRINQRDIHN